MRHTLNALNVESMERLQIFGGAVQTIARSTLMQWVGKTGVKLQSLVDLLRKAVLA